MLIGLSLVFALFNVSAQHLVFGQINLLLGFLCLWGMTRSWAPRWLPRGALIGVAAGIKLTPALFVVFFLVAGRWREAVASIGAFLATVAIGAVLLPRSTSEYFLGQLTGLSSVVDLGENFATSGNSSLQGVAQRWLGTHDLLVLAPLLLIVVIAAFVAAHRAQRRDEPALAVAVIGVAMCLLSPVSWLHHWVWVFPAVVLLWGRGRAGTALAILWSLACLAQLTDLGDMAGRSDTVPLVLVELMRSSMVLLGLAFLAVALLPPLRERSRDSVSRVTVGAE